MLAQWLSPWAVASGQGIPRTCPVKGLVVVSAAPLFCETRHGMPLSLPDLAAAPLWSGDLFLGSALAFDFSQDVGVAQGLGGA